MNHSKFHQTLPYITALALSFLGGGLFKLMHIPLPWMLGPLFFSGLAGVGGLKVKNIPGSRQAGQLVVGCGLGLYFTAEVGGKMLNFAPYILSAAFIAIMIGALGSLILKRIAGVSSSTAFFACAPGGAAEMAVLAERFGARFDQVALCHSIRLLIVVSIIPFAVTFSGANGAEEYIQLSNSVNLKGILLLALFAIPASYAFAKLKIPNAWLLGSLFMIMAITLNGFVLSAIPSLLTTLAQILIGCSLGVRFKPSLRSESKSLLLGVIISGLFTLLLSCLFGLLFAWLMDESGAMLILATAPGGLAEMCLTAKILKLGVPLVTAFQVARLAIVVTCTAPAWRIFSSIRSKA